MFKSNRRAGGARTFPIWIAILLTGLAVAGFGFARPPLPLPLPSWSKDRQNIPETNVEDEPDQQGSIPPIDAERPAHLEMATFALG